MKKILLVLLTSIYASIYCQINSDSTTIKFNKAVDEYRNLKIQNDDIEKMLKCINRFPAEYSKILELDDITNIAIQKALFQEYANECNNSFDYTLDGKKITNSFMIGFKSKETFIKYYELQKTNIELIGTGKLLQILFEHEKEWENKVNATIDRNLIRLKISRADYDNLSQNDKELLWKTFK